MKMKYCMALLLLVGAMNIRADSADVLQAGAADALSLLRAEVRGADALLDEAVAILVMPSVVALGFGEGGEYGEGVLLVDSKPVAYYAVSGGDMGKRHDSAQRTQVLVFNERQALIDFRNSRDWLAHRDDNLHMASYRSSGKLSRDNAAASVVGFVLDSKGPRKGLSISGSTYRRIAR